MTITTITCTRDRPEAFKLCELYLKRQTVKPNQMLVLDDGNTPVTCTLGQQYFYCPEARNGISMLNKLKIAFAPGVITSDAVVFTEDDDWFAPTWLEECTKALTTAWIFGEGRAVYYNVHFRWWFEHINMNHASLCSTAIRKELFNSVRALAVGKNAFIDEALWRMVRRDKQKLIDPNTRGGKRLIVGIKGMPGTLGYSGAHSVRDKSAKDDPDLVKLISLISTDVSLYEEFWTQYVPPQNLKVSVHTETGRVHGPKWMRWLKHLVDKPGAVGAEIGTFRGESAEFMCENIFTAPDAEYYCIDPFTGSVEHGLAGIDCTTLESDTRARLKNFPQAKIIKGYSQDALMAWTRKQLDFCYVDGDHTAMAAMRDAVMAFEILKVGGVLAWDDYEWTVMPRPVDCPKLGIDGFLAAYADRIEILQPRGWQVAVKKLK